MKKIGLVGMMVILLALAITLPVIAKEVPITEANIALLKGTWNGYRSVNTMGRVWEFGSELTIKNDSLPLKGLMVNNPTPSNPLISYPFENGIIEKGKLFIQWGKKQWNRFTLYENKGKLELRGEFRWDDGKFSDISGTISLKKQ